MSKKREKERDLGIVVAQLENKVAELEEVINALVDNQNAYNEVLSSITGVPLEQEIEFDADPELIEALNPDKKNLN